MLNQAFSPENFRRIFDIENRRGVNLAGEFFPDLDAATKEIKDCMADIRGLQKKKRALDPEEYNGQKSALNGKKLELEKKKEEILSTILKEMSMEAADPNFRVELQQVMLRGGKRAYTIKKTAAAYFVVKQLQHNFRRLYKVKQSSRYDILCQLRGLLADSFPKYVIRLRDRSESVLSLEG
jgi:hypothetical protein